ncbi:alpha/beta hydrolase family esterase [Nocardia terpenica]|nr:PHB depolymerase family esterase [Nocardia terpenica]
MNVCTQRGKAFSTLCYWCGAAAAAILLVAAVGPVTARADDGSPSRSAACAQSPDPTPTNGTVTREVQSLVPVNTPAGTVAQLSQRTYYVNVPAGLTGPAPLMIANHGANASAQNLEQGTGWDQYAAEHHFIIAYSQSLVNDPVVIPGVAYPGDVWFFDQNSFDVQYLAKVVTDIEAKWCVDTSRVHNSGFSEGAIMAQRMACDASSTFAAIASWEGSDSTLPDPLSVLNPCNPSRPIAVGIFQGSADPYSQPQVGQEDIDIWTTRDNCPGKPILTGYPLFNATPSSSSTDTYGTSQFYAGCSGGITEIWRVMSGVAHTWPPGAAGQDLRDQQWNYLDNYTLPQD